MIAISDIIEENLICLNLDLKNKIEVIEYLTKIAKNAGKFNKKEADAVNGYIAEVLEREKVFSTAVGYKFGIPHSKNKYVNDVFLIYARLNEEIDWEDEENEKVKHIFMIGVSDKKIADDHLEILIKLSTAILNDDFREELEVVENEKDAFEIIKKYTGVE